MGAGLNPTARRQIAELLEERPEPLTPEEVALLLGGPALFALGAALLGLTALLRHLRSR